MSRQLAAPAAKLSAHMNKLTAKSIDQGSVEAKCNRVLKPGLFCIAISWQICFTPTRRFGFDADGKTDKMDCRPQKQLPLK
jgi:hypothetical protein